MKDWYDNLEAREQVFVLTGAVFVLIALVYFLLWAPLDRHHKQVATSVANWERSLAELRPLRSMASTANIDTTQVSGSSQQAPIIIVDQTLRGRDLEQFRRRSQPTANNGIRVEFENVAFDELVVWLGDLGTQYDLHVQAGSMSIQTQAGPGRINASLTLERAP
jgi:general secretion pathway protein M